MYLQKTIKLQPNQKQQEQITNLMEEYIRAVNFILDIFIEKGPEEKITYAQITMQLPGSMKSAAIKDAKRQYGFYKKLNAEDNMRILLNPGVPIKKRIPYIKKPYAKWTKNSCSIYRNRIVFPAWSAGHFDLLQLKALMPEEVYKFFNTHPPVAIELVWKQHKLLCHFTYFEKEPAPCIDPQKETIMGIDLNLKCPAVCVTSENKVLFAGNGRENQYVRRHYKAIREKFQKESRQKELDAIKHKEQQYMNNQDHQISREVINFAIKEQVTEIHMEKLIGAQKKIMPPQKIAREQIHSWSYFRLAQYIEYKAKLAGIRVVYVSPVFTSQICPKCQEKTKPIKGGMFHCPVCGYHVHNDLLAAMNIRDREPIKRKTQTTKQR